MDTITTTTTTTTTSSNPKLGRCDGKGGGEDRISRLPDGILSHILSFSTTTKDAVRTSALSKQWRRVWTSVPIVEISDDDDIHAAALLSTPHDNDNDEDPKKLVRRGLFMDFVDMVLRFNDAPCLRSFYLSCDGDYYDLLRIGRWMHALIARDVEVLELSFLNGQQLELPPQLFTSCSSSKLVCLKLNEVIFPNIPTSAYLPSLKIIHLSQVAFCNDVSMKNLLDGCPILEELDIWFELWCPAFNTLFVRSSSLKRLRLYNHAWRHGYQLGMVLDVPNLEHLQLFCSAANLCHVSNLSSLNQVQLRIYDVISDSSGLKEEEKLVELLRKMSNTKYMCLTNSTMRTLVHAGLDNLPVFSSLTRLELYVDELSWHALPYLLECSPNLITSFFYLYSTSPIGDQQFRTPKRLMLYLEEIEIRGFKGCANGMDMVKYFLKNATILKKMSIQSEGSKTKEILAKVLTFPRTSTACQIASN